MRMKSIKQSIFLKVNTMFRITVILVGTLVLSLLNVSTSAADKGLSDQNTVNQEQRETEPNTVVIDFGKYPIGKLPDGFSASVTDGGQPGKWEIVDANGTKVLAQTNTDETNGRFPLCIYDTVSIKNVEVSTDFMAIAGKVDQAAGLVARYKDNNNYYVTRANALEDNVRLYKVESGKRKQIGGANLKVTSGTWHSLKLEIEGVHQKVFYDGKLIIDANDATFPNAGKVGFWTKADSFTYFSNLKIEPAAAIPHSRLYTFTMDDIGGQQTTLSQYKGKVLLIVNVASKCGFTKQYAGLQELYMKYKDRRFVVLGFPANNFGGQEPGSNSEIKEFCSTKFSVTFPMFSKISVKGDDIHPLYKYLTSTTENAPFGGPIEWNFNKFLIGRDGKTIGRFPSATAPLDTKVIEAIESGLEAAVH